MAYKKLNLTDGTVLTAEHLKHFESGIANSGGIGTVGGDTAATGLYAHAEGYNTTASAYYAHAEGEGTTASGTDSHAEGTESTASAFAAHAEGNMCSATSVGSHAEGYITKSSGYGSHSEGMFAEAKKDGSHAEGYDTIAGSINQHVQGRYNVEDSANKYAHIVGNGKEENSVKQRSNAHTLDWNGVPWYAGDRVMLGGTGMDDGAAVALMPIFVAQTLTDDQKAQARANIGVDAYIEAVILGGAW